MEGINLATTHKSSFRIMGLSVDDVETLEDELLIGCKYRTGSNHKDRSEKLVVIPLDKTITSGFLQSIINKVSSYKTYEFYISTCNNNESFIIEVPEHICKLMHEVGGGITFSYTYAGDEGT